MPSSRSPDSWSLSGGSDPALAFQADPTALNTPSGFEPVLGGALRERAVWVDESVCIGCRYCAHVAFNTFLVEEAYGRSRVIRQDGDSTERIQEAIDTCPVDCIHWVPFEELSQLQNQLDAMELQPLGFPAPSRHRRVLPRER